MTGGGRPSSRAAWTGFIEAVTAAALWGTSGIFSVRLFHMGVRPETVALWRPVLGLGVLLAFLAVRRLSALRIQGRGLLLLLTVGGVSVGVFQLAYQLSTDAVGVPATVALLYLAPALVVLASGPLLGEWPTPARALLAATVTVGVWLSVLGAHRVDATFGSAGVGWGITAAVCYAGYLLLGRYAAPRWGSIPTMVYSTASACVLLAVALPLLGGPVPLPSGGKAWGLLVVFGLLTIAVAQSLFFDALSRVEASPVAVASTAEPLTAALLATLLLGQGLEPLGWLGLGLVLVGVAGVGATLPRRPKGS